MVKSKLISNGMMKIFFIYIFLFSGCVFSESHLSTEGYQIECNKNHLNLIIKGESGEKTIGMRKEKERIKITINDVYYSAPFYIKDREVIMSMNKIFYVKNNQVISSPSMPTSYNLDLQNSYLDINAILDKERSKSTCIDKW